jgi:DNA polymerase I-like protein with 3'-5' exonuclease and polymerase domains
MTNDKAGELIDRWFAKAFKLRKWLDDQKAMALKFWYSTTRRGRKRFYRKIDQDDPDKEAKRAQVGRWAGNQPIQGECVDMLKRAMSMISLALHGGDLRKPRIYEAHLLACVHDEIIVHAREDHAEPVAAIVKGCMDAVYHDTIKTIKGETEVTIADYWKK